MYGQDRPIEHDRQQRRHWPYPHFVFPSLFYGNCQKHPDRVEADPEDKSMHLDRMEASEPRITRCRSAYPGTADKRDPWDAKDSVDTASSFLPQRKRFLTASSLESLTPIGDGHLSILRILPKKRSCYSRTAARWESRQRGFYEVCRF